MLGSRRWTKQAWLLVCSSAWLGLSGCSGTSFSSSPTGGSGGGSNNSAGTNSDGGTENAGSNSGGSNNSGGDITSGGAPDPGGSGGTGGAVTPSCDCPAGRYCREGSTDCFDCAELNRLRFTTPERLATLSDNGQGSYFPRVGSTTTDLVYLFTGTGLRYTTDSSTSAGSSVKSTQPQDSGPLLLSENVTTLASLPLMGVNFLFDRGTTDERELYASRWQDGAQANGKLPAPFNGGISDYSIAVALHPGASTTPRAFWMSTRDGKPQLYTAPLQDMAAMATVVELRLAKDRMNPDAMTPLTCPTSEADLAPWVTRDGKTLLFSHTRVDANCAAVPSQKSDLYTTLLQPATGQPPMDATSAIVPATPMNDVNSAADDVEPSFSADMCDLYFASNRDGNFGIYRAHRR